MYQNLIGDFMADLTSKFAKFFISEHTKFSDFENSLKESAVKNNWVEAVVLFRQGMKKLGENDLSGYEDIKKANESLKAVVSGGKEDITQKATQLTESISNFDTVKMDINEQVERLKYQLGSLYDVLKENGMPTMDDEDEFFDDDMDDEDDADEGTPVATATAVIDPAAVPVSEKPVPIVVEVTAVPMTQPNNTAVPPSSEPTPVPPSSSPAVMPDSPSAGAVSAPTDSKTQPAMPATEAAVRESAFEHGVLEARKRWKMGENAKNVARQIAEKELCEKSYSYVNRWMEGFNYGYGFEEQVKRDTDPTLFETEKSNADDKK